MNKFILFLIGLFLSHSVTAYELAEDLQVHGFFTQNAVSTSGNNMYGKSDNSISTDFTEAGLNLFYKPFENISFSFQGLYRNAGNVDNDTVDIDYAFVDFNLKNYKSGRYGLRLGRVKNPFGLYNETRDVAFTTPSIILPQGIYFDGSRSLLLSSDGMQFYWEHILNNGDFNFRLNYGNTRNDNDEILYSVIPNSPLSNGLPAPRGDLESIGSDPAFLAYMSYELNGGEYVYAFSYADVKLYYDPKAFDYYQNGTTEFKRFVLSAQYNGEKWSVMGEFSQQDNKFKNFNTVLFPDLDSTSESWYLQVGYRFQPKWQLYGRYDETYKDKDNRNGKGLMERTGLPDHIVFSKDIMMGIRWDVNSSMMVRAEYHNINGSSWLTSADNPVIKDTEQYWDLFIMQLSFRF